ncbi:AraC family transcriptional regulator ligand-binding domain-containing protein [Paraflavitalea speifideaquila]|uniref:AraC family transcriptional regulator ligand-binding domain-containing protein n=1 Tax=Paraflavitalea speifideaquila TaxID=3076558 RepID=UPI0028F069A3|nr:AraC family transcriptional regulator ligand-binding domain-containing protein [Paraflavitalea speifideiaquila]
MDYARVRGIAWQDMEALIKQPPVDLMDEQATVEEEDLYTVIQFIDEQLKDKAWGIQCGHFISMKLLGLIYKISLQATTIQEALHYLQSYLAAAVPLVKAETAITTDAVAIHFSVHNRLSALNRIILEYTLAVVGREIRLMAGEGVAIRISSPAYLEDYPAAWSYAETYTVAFEPIVLKAALRNTSHLQVDILVPEYLKMIEQLKPDDSFAGKVKVTLLSMSDPQLPDIQTVSGALYVTPRTLQRRLGAEGITFRELLEEIKSRSALFCCAMTGIPLPVSPIYWVMRSQLLLYIPFVNGLVIRPKDCGGRCESAICNLLCR